MIEEFYGFSMSPFKLTPDPEFFFAAQTYTRALAYMRYGLQQGEGMIVLTGDAGTGKSTLISYLLKQIDKRKVTIGNLTNSNLDPGDVLLMVARALGITVSDRLGKADALTAIHKFLNDLRKRGRRALLIVDEIQTMPRASVEELRMLTNPNAQEGASLQCFLVGQTQFRHMIEDPGMQQLRQRIIGSCHLDPLSDEETQDYINHRLSVAGWNGRPSFHDTIPGLIHQATQGIPRQINVLFGRLLVHGAIERRELLTEDDCLDVISELVAEGEVGANPIHQSRSKSDMGAAEASTLEQRLAGLEGRISELETVMVKLVRMTMELAEHKQASGKREPDT